MRVTNAVITRVKSVAKDQENPPPGLLFGDSAGNSTIHDINPADQDNDVNNDANTSTTASVTDDKSLAGAGNGVHQEEVEELATTAETSNNENGDNVDGTTSDEESVDIKSKMATTMMTMTNRMKSWRHLALKTCVNQNIQLAPQCANSLLKFQTNQG